jgi:trigger factor
MQVTKKNLSETNVELSVTTDRQELRPIKDKVLSRLGRDVKVSGFRAGKAPEAMVEKQLDPSRLQSEFLDEAINQFYVQAAQSQKLRPVAQPEVTITKFVPFDTLEFTAVVDAVGEVALPDYKAIKVSKKVVKVTPKDVDEVIKQLLLREAEKKEVKRSAKDGDEVIIDFRGIDTKLGEPVQGADSKDFPLVLGSNAFIPGFEPELIGLKAGSDKTFDIAFPKTYSVKALQGRKVTFTVAVKKVQAVTEPKLTDAFAAKIGPFKTLQELKADIKQQLTKEQEQQAERDYENDLINKIADATEVAIPKVLVDDQLEQLEREERKNLTYKGQTWQEHLSAEGVSEEQHREKNRPDAEMRVKIGLALSEIADKEAIMVTPEEFEVRLQMLKGQYEDKTMQEELEKTENRRELLNRMISEKTLDKLVSYGEPRTK